MLYCGYYNIPVFEYVFRPNLVFMVLCAPRGSSAV